MSRFADLLKQPLPSKRRNSYDSFFESEEVDPFESDLEDMADNVQDDEDDIFADMDKEEQGDIFESDDDFGSDSANTDTEEDDIFASDDEPIDPQEESREIDETIKRVATPVLIGDTLADDEVAVFKESMDSDIAIDEGYFTERTIVRMDKGSKRKQLIKISALTIARQKKDPLYKKLATVWKMERSLEAKIYKKYESAAKQRANKYIQNAKKSKSKAVKQAASKVVKGR